MRLPTTSRSSTAFTLIELMVVLGLIGIVSAVIIPEMRGTYQDALLRSTSRQLIGAFQLAGSRAVSLQRQHRVLIHSGKKSYRIEQKGGAQPGFSGLKDVAGSDGGFDSRISVEVRRPEDAAVEESATVAEDLVVAEPGEGRVEGITFYPDGTAEQREIVVKDNAGFKSILSINPVTSRVEIKETPPR